MTIPFEGTAQEFLQVADDCDATADKILVTGWCRGSLRKPDGRMCLEGALLSAVLPLEVRATVAYTYAFNAGADADEVLRTLVENDAIDRSLVVRVFTDLRFLRRAIRHTYPARYASASLINVWVWNDEQTSQEAVTDLLRNTAKQLRELAAA